MELLVFAFPTKINTIFYKTSLTLQWVLSNTLAIETKTLLLVVQFLIKYVTFNCVELSMH